MIPVLPRPVVLIGLIILIGFPLAFFANRVLGAPPGTGVLIGVIVIGVITTIDRVLRARQRR